MFTDGMNDGKCPKCENLIINVKIEKVSASLGTAEYQAISLHCGHKGCNTVLSVQVDPAALRNLSEKKD